MIIFPDRMWPPAASMRPRITVQSFPSSYATEIVNEFILGGPEGAMWKFDEILRGLHERGSTINIYQVHAITIAEIDNDDFISPHNIKLRAYTNAEWN